MEKRKKYIAMAEAGNNREKASRATEKSNTNHPEWSILNPLLKDDLAEQESWEETGNHFHAWFAGWMSTIRKLVENPAFQEPSLMLEIDFFLHDIEHHFTPSSTSQRVWNAFRYLRHYFNVYPCVTARHSKNAIAMLDRLHQSRNWKAKDAGKEVSAWFNNRMCVTLMAIENPRFRDHQSMMRIQFFLREIQCCFIKTGDSRHFRNAFRYLKRYFQVYPCVRRRQSEKALEMTARVYQAIGYKFRHQAKIKYGLMDVEGKVQDRMRTTCQKLYPAVSAGTAA